MSRAILEAPTISPAADLIGEIASDTCTCLPSLCTPHGFVMFDGFASAYPIEDIVHLGATVGRNNDVDALADRFRRGISEQAFGGPVPAGDGAVERLGDDRVVG